MAENDASMIIESVQQYWPNFPITQHQLEHPTSEFVIEFYHMFQESMKNILWRMTNGNDELIEQPGTMNESVISLLPYVNKYLNSVTHPDIDCVLTLTDLYEPSAKRTMIRFKILLSVLSFYESEINIFRGTVQKRLYQTQEYISKKSEKEILKEALAKEAEGLARMDDNIGKLEKQLEKTNARYANLQLQKGDNDRKHNKLQLDLDALIKTYENKETLLTNVKTTIQHLHEQVVTADSYKSMLDLKENLVKKSEDLDDETDCFVKSLGGKKPAVERFENIAKLKQKLNANCEELECVQNLVLNEKTELKSEQQDYQKKEYEIEKLNEKKMKTKENLAKLKEASQISVSKLNNDIVKFQEENEQMKLEIGREEGLRINLANEKDELTVKNEMLKRECDDITTSIQELNLLYANTYENMLKAENEATHNLTGLLSNMGANLKKKL